MAYYYLTASLPLLRIDDPVPFTVEKFLESNQSLIDPAHLEQIQCVIEGRLEACRHPFLKEWRDRDTQLRNAAARARGQAGRGNPEKYTHEHEGYDVRTERAVAEAMSMENPMQAEMALDKLRWRILDDMVLQDPFGPSAVFAFVIKLMIAQRWALLTEEKGEQSLNEIVKNQIESVAEGNNR